MSHNLLTPPPSLLMRSTFFAEAYFVPVSWFSQLQETSVWPSIAWNETHLHTSLNIFQLEPLIGCKNYEIIYTFTGTPSPSYEMLSHKWKMQIILDGALQKDLKVSHLYVNWSAQMHWKLILMQIHIHNTYTVYMHTCIYGSVFLRLHKPRTAEP